MSESRKTPLVIVTGFLGSGKTTLLGKLLQGEEFAGTSVLINEYGQAGLDHRLIRRVKERTVLLAGGCVCCNRREDLVRELSDMLNDYQAGKMLLDRVVIETTGLADPAPILFSILTHPMLVHHYRIDMVIACLDAVNGELHLQNNPESVKQITSADKVVITKADLSGPELAEKLRQRVLSLNPSAQISLAEHGQAEEGLLTVPAAFDRERLGSGLSDSGTQHAADVHAMTVQFAEPLDWLAFGVWLSMLLQKHGENIFRVKGIVDVGEKGPVVLNGVQHVIHPPRHLSDWQDYETRDSQIVFIMRGIEPRQILQSLQAFQHLIGAAPKIQELNLNMFT